MAAQGNVEFASVDFDRSDDLVKSLPAEVLTSETCIGTYRQHSNVPAFLKRDLAQQNTIDGVGTVAAQFHQCS